MAEKREPLDNVKKTMALYRSLEEEKRKREEEEARRAEQGEPEPASAIPPAMRRLRFTRTNKGKPTIDLSKAEPDCELCGGTGRLADHVIEPEEGEECERMQIPVVCRCVKRNGGVVPDLLDKLAAGHMKKKRWADRRKQRRREKNRNRVRRRR